MALGLARQGGLVDSTGTGEALVSVRGSADLPSAAASTNRYACYPHCMPDKYLVLGHLGVVGGVLDWVTSLVGRDPGPLDIHPDLPIYIPHFNSNRHTVEESGAWVGISPACNAGDLLSSVMEGVCYWFRQSAELAEMAGIPCTIKLVGGLARYHQLTQLKADVMGSPIEVLDYPDLALLGAAIVAGIGVGMYSSWEAHKRETALSTHVVTPGSGRSGLYEARYRRYRQFAAQLEWLMTDRGAEPICTKLGGEV
ncbi:MAG: FGGY-family carbohydrate kinase [Bacteroidota bacterium]